MKFFVALTLVVVAIALVGAQKASGGSSQSAGGQASASSDKSAKSPSAKGGASAKSPSAKGGDDKYNLPYFFGIIDNKVKKAYKVNSIREIIDYIVKNEKGAYGIYAYISLFKILQSEKKLDQPEVVDLAFKTKELMDLVGKDNAAYHSGMAIREDLPKSVGNLVFSKCILIRRASVLEDMYAPNDNFKTSKNRRPIFTWIRHEPQNNKQGCWSVMPDPSGNSTSVTAYLIQNTASKEYVYAGQDNVKINKDRRYVLSWVPGGHDNQSEWSFEPSGDNIYIKNILFGEYMSVDDQTKRDPKRRNVFTLMSKGKTKDSLWQILDGDTQKKPEEKPGEKPEEKPKEKPEEKPQ